MGNLLDKTNSDSSIGARAPARRIICRGEDLHDAVPVICDGWATSIATLADSSQQILSILSICKMQENHALPMDEQTHISSRVAGLSASGLKYSIRALCGNYRRPNRTIVITVSSIEQKMLVPVLKAVPKGMITKFYSDDRSMEFSSR